MGAFSAQCPNMIGAYTAGKDLYAQVAAVAFDSTYEDCLEFYQEGRKIIYEGEEVVCGNDKESIIDVNDNIISLPYYKLIMTPNDFTPICDLNIGDCITAEDGNYTIKNKIVEGETVTLHL